MSARVLFAAGLLVTLAAVGCRTAPIQNVYASALAPPASMSDAAMIDAFRRAGAETGWQIQPVAPGELEGHLTVRGRHFAVVTISYDRTQFSIVYKSSENLLYDGIHIHRNYNRWVLALAQNIRKTVDLYPANEGTQGSAAGEG
ncbi:MAG: hypothetical protein IT386_10215 [Deltaproteobacteria bacterium]|nr:hypothetical protein [Deltaproteobacteria bacterium]